MFDVTVGMEWKEGCKVDLKDKYGLQDEYLLEFFTKSDESFIFINFKNIEQVKEVIKILQEKVEGLERHE